MLEVETYSGMRASPARVGGNALTRLSAGSSVRKWCGGAAASVRIQNAEIADRIAPLPGIGVGRIES